MKKASSGTRPRRVGELIQQELAPLVRNHFQGKSYGLITLLEVDVSPDFSSAKVYFSLLNTSAAENVQTCERALNGAAAHLRHELTQQMSRMRRVPRLHFIYDDTTVKANALARLIDETVASDNAEKNATPE